MRRPLAAALLLLLPLASTYAPLRRARPRTSVRPNAESNAQGGQFGGRSGCCYKADNWLNSMSAAPVEESAAPVAEESVARRLTAGGPPNGANAWHEAWIGLLAKSLRAAGAEPMTKLCDPLGLPRADLAYASDELVLVSHGTEAAPVFNYANLAAQRLWELDWGAFLSLESAKSAEPVERSEREDLLRRVEADGFVDDYRGVRVSSSGQRFEIKDAYVWNVMDGGARVGQAALFRRGDVTFL